MSTKPLDNSQRAVVTLPEGHHLVLAPPGCGKTHILAERVRYAHERGVSYDDMLCLTFTNRAARGMRERVTQTLANDTPCTVFVGNVHRYCSQMLYDSGIVPANSAVIDEEEAFSLLCEYTNADEQRIRTDRSMQRAYSEVVQLAAFMRQLRNKHPRELRIHPDVVKPQDIVLLKEACKKQGREFTLDAMLDIYDNIHLYCTAERMTDTIFNRMMLARQYTQAKTDNLYLDFEDLLLTAYEALRDDKEGKLRRYKWIQVDEVQDLNAMQIAIIDLLTAPDHSTVVYLGDEQQAIFSFMGAKLSTLKVLSDRCGKVWRLGNNYRSPSYLLDVFNDFACNNLNIPRELLPEAWNKKPKTGNELLILPSYNQDEEFADVAGWVGTMREVEPQARIAVVVLSNNDADLVANQLTARGISHFKISGQDMFSTPAMKLMLSHFGVAHNVCNYLAWATILRQTRTFDTNKEARRFVRALKSRALTPADALLYPDGESYISDFAKAYDEQIITVFDTETTGLDTDSDDVVELSAVKMRGGKILTGSEFDVFIRTGRKIPEKLGDKPNPMIREYQRHDLLSPQEALYRFHDYADGTVLLGHNVMFDKQIMLSFMHRHTPELKQWFESLRFFDSLRVSRMILPGQLSYKLEALLAEFHLEGINSHLSIDDVKATANLTRHLRYVSQDVIARQRQFLTREDVTRRLNKLRAAYGDYFHHTQQRLFEPQQDEERPVLTDELQWIYKKALDDGFISPLDKWNHFINFVEQDVVDTTEQTNLSKQLQACYMRLSTTKEADMCGSDVGSMKEMVFVSTVHKAKGLEFDNVIVVDVVEGRCPNYYNSQRSEADRQRLDAEDARKLYVALSRAKAKLFVFYGRHNYNRETRLSSFMNAIIHHFRILDSAKPDKDMF
ncbi:MAG: UvrD-helicase domain-containing protein [Prevotella sp.]|nr:UvrD-helicase domain-containing protein [Prevotella sp.]